MESIEWILKAPAAIKVIKYSQDKSVLLSWLPNLVD